MFFARKEVVFVLGAPAGGGKDNQDFIRT